MIETRPLISIVVPAWNEAETIAYVVTDLEQKFSEEGISFEIVVVDNGSTDGTGLVLEGLKEGAPHLKVVRVAKNAGYGNGILCGLAEANGNILGWIDADGQSVAVDVAESLRLFLKERYDVCKGVRRARMDSTPRLIQSRVYNVLFRALFDVPFNDINAKPKFFTREVYERTGLSSRDYFIDAELVIKAVRLGSRIGEISVKGDVRHGGSSKVRIGTLFEFLKNMLVYKCRYGKKTEIN